MNVRLDEKVIVITGSSRGLGSCLADAMAKEGAHMVINYNKSDCAAHNIAESIIGNGGDCLVIRADVSKEEEVEYLYSQVREHFGKVDVLINNAGICLDAPIVDMDVNDWCKVMDINLKGAYLCSHFFGRMMVEQNYGKIINIASIKGVEGCINRKRKVLGCCG